MPRGFDVTPRQFTLLSDGFLKTGHEHVHKIFYDICVNPIIIRVSPLHLREPESAHINHDHVHALLPFV